jgi:hypothetical protein
MPATPLSRVPRPDDVLYQRDLSAARQRARLALAAAKRCDMAPLDWLDGLHADMLVAVAGAPPRLASIMLHRHEVLCLLILPAALRLRRSTPVPAQVARQPARPPYRMSAHFPLQWPVTRR